MKDLILKLEEGLIADMIKKAVKGDVSKAKWLSEVGRLVKASGGMIPAQSRGEFWQKALKYRKKRMTPEAAAERLGTEFR